MAALSLNRFPLGTRLRAWPWPEEEKVFDSILGAWDPLGHGEGLRIGVGMGLSVNGI